MFGFPTGIGALVLAPGVGAWLREKRPWFAGGTVDVVQVPGLVVGRTAAIDEAFEVSCNPLYQHQCKHLKRNSRTEH